jgi:predicted AAA+ superfamily ATPase
MSKYINEIVGHFQGDAPAGSVFFLFGPRGTGKSTLLRQKLPDTPFFNLLNARTFLELSQNPTVLEARIGALPRGDWVCIDEIQKIPPLFGRSSSPD